MIPGQLLTKISSFLWTPIHLHPVNSSMKVNINENLWYVRSRFTQDLLAFESSSVCPSLRNLILVPLSLNFIIQKEELSNHIEISCTQFTYNTRPHISGTILTTAG